MVVRVEGQGAETQKVVRQVKRRGREEGVQGVVVLERQVD